jgi:hypothetical protein
MLGKEYYAYGGRDTMKFDMAQALNFASYARSEFRKSLTAKWEKTGNNLCANTVSNF